jgi:hypothetical protein
LSISIIAFMTRFAFPASGSANISPRKTGLTCHERPNLSLSQSRKLSGSIRRRRKVSPRNNRSHPGSRS